MNLSMNLKKLTLFLILIGIITLGSGGVYYYRNVYKIQKKINFMKQANISLRVDNIEKAISVYQQLLSETLTERERREVTSQLATSLFLTQDLEKQKQAVELIKKEVINFKNSPLSRAYFVVVLGTFLNQAPTREFRYAVIWNNEPYKSFGEPAFSFKVAERKLFEYANSIAPTAIGELKVGYWYASQLMIDKSLTTSIKKEYSETALRHINTGEFLIPHDSQNLPIDRSFHARTLLQSAKGIFAIHNLGGSVKDVKNSFEKLIFDMEKEAGAPSQNPYIYDMALLTRFQYASFLVHAYDSSEKDKIAEVIQPIIASPLRRSFYVYLREKVKSPPPVSSPGGYPSLPELKLIAEISPEFKAYLNQLGGNL